MVLIVSTLLRLNRYLSILIKMSMWGANKWTDDMFRKYWWVVATLIVVYVVWRIAA
jgi:hypothetical protein